MNPENAANWKVNVVTSLEELYLLKNEWDRLLDENNYRTINLSHEWLSTVWKHYVLFDKTAKLHVLCIREPNNELVAILPLMTVTIHFKIFFRIKQLCFLGHDFNDYSGFIIKRNFEEKIFNLFLSSILSKTIFIDWDILLLKNISSKNQYFDHLCDLFLVESYDLEVKKITKYFYIKTNKGLFKDYYQALTKNFRNDLRKCHNKLERYSNENAKTIRIIFGDDRVRDKKFISVLTSWQIQRMRNVNKTSSFTNESVRSFRYDFINSFYEHVLAVTLNLDDVPIAFCICLIYKNKLFFWSHGSDPNFYFLSPNKIIIEKIIEYCFSKGYELCDFNRGDHSYKEKWSKDYYYGYLLRTYNYRKQLMKLLTCIN